MGNRRRLVAFAVFAALIVLWLVPTAGASHSKVTDADATASSTRPAESVEISGGLAYSGAVITGPHAPTRRLTAYQSAVFMQSWIGDAFCCKPKHESVPVGVPVYRLDVMGTWGGGADFSARAVYYASDGKQAWIAFPSPQRTPSTGSPARLDWFVAPSRVIQAFAGTAKLIPTLGTDTSPSNAAVPRDAAKHTVGNSAWPWIGGAAAAVAAFGVVVGWRRRTRPA